MPLNVFITGASGGIGAAFARAYAARGATLGLSGHRKEALDALAASLPGGKHRTYASDVTDRNAMIAAARDFEAAAGPADIVIACAGISIGVQSRYYEDLEVLQRTFDINVIGTANTFHGFLGSMIRRRAGTLVGIASVGGIRGLPGAEAYSASKAAVISYCESLRIEMRKEGVSVVTLCPGYVDTALSSKDPYSRPFLLQPDEFARRALRAIDRKDSYAVIPWQMGVLAKAMRAAPNWLLDRILSKRKMKPREQELKGR
ncbi:MAG: SDR family oxidoreductase [Sutterellaceae bacterium]|nr:SDR family oxidoreductase [Sutterellaceae bacterium]MDD7441715.1 SDR family oxidoreductase [Sutterellaceae bacterium]MDY2869275.1 SDR family oxidoreductase [Mesosutterella sp.]